MCTRLHLAPGFGRKYPMVLSVRRRPVGSYPKIDMTRIQYAVHDWLLFQFFQLQVTLSPKLAMLLMSIEFDVSGK